MLPYREDICFNYRRLLHEEGLACVCREAQGFSCCSPLRLSRKTINMAEP